MYKEIERLKNCRKIYTNFSSRKDLYSITELLRDNMQVTDIKLVNGQKVGPDAYYKDDNIVIMAEHFEADSYGYLDPKGDRTVYHNVTNSGKVVKRGGSNKRRAAEAIKSGSDFKIYLDIVGTFERLLESIKHGLDTHYPKVEKKYPNNLKEKFGVEYTKGKDMCVFVIDITDPYIKYDEYDEQLSLSDMGHDTYEEHEVVVANHINVEEMITPRNGMISSAAILLTKELKEALLPLENIDFFIFMVDNAAFTVEPEKLPGKYDIKHIVTTDALHVEMTDRIGFTDLYDIELHHVGKNERK